MITVGVIGWVTVLAVSSALERQAQRGVENEVSALVDEFNAGGRPDLEAALTGRFANPLIHTRYVLIGTDGAALLGDATLLPYGRDPADPWVAPAGGPRAAARTLGDGSRVVVVDDLVGVRDVEAVVTRAFLTALAMAGALGLGTGILLAGALLRRLDAVTRTAEAVVAGDMTQRIARTGSGDEFDRLAATLNRMLDRIDGLMVNLRQVSTDIAHDLRTPLSRLRQNLEATNRRAVSVEVYKAAVEQAVEETDRILDIFSALLRIAQIEASTLRKGFRPINLSELFHTLADAYAAPAGDGGRTLTALITADVWVQADQDLLAQLFVNLVENALLHTPQGSTISLQLDVSGSVVVAAVCDDGPGIPIAEREKVLRRFYRLERSRSGLGNGLGLSLAAAVAELHGGRLTLSDAEPGLQVSVTFAREATLRGIKGQRMPKPSVSR
ncbi:HAMP domain-containing sensor histidine kinase [Methylobacterium oryzae]|uniref:HAMP domain-containing sensor histidine kinase n=1 Tax=Methylobacterium oryzae TaxID=334852 RepID=UPI002F35B0ED